MAFCEEKNKRVSLFIEGYLLDDCLAARTVRIGKKNLRTPENQHSSAETQT